MTGQHLVEDVEVALVFLLTHDSGLFEQVRDNVSCFDVSRVTVKVDLDEFTESRRVNVLECLSVAESFEERVRVQNVLSNADLRSFHERGVGVTIDITTCCLGQITQKDLASFSLAGTRVSGYNN